jgi:putative MATE family efflux protein
LSVSFSQKAGAASGQEVSRLEIRRMVLNLSLPAITEMLLVSLVSIADMVMVGRLGEVEGALALAAVGLSNQPMFFAMSVFMALNVGSTALIARLTGAGERAQANEGAKQAAVLATGLALFIGTAGYLSAEPIIRFMGAEPEVLPLGVAYFKIASISMVFASLSMGLSAALRGSGDTKTPMRINMAANVLNVIGNYLLIYGKFGFPAMGVVGAALATSIARAIAAVMVVYTIMSGKARIRISFRDGYRFNRELVGRIVKVGIPAAIEQLVMRSGQVVFVRVVASLGFVTMAAHQIALNIMSLSFMPGQGFGMAASTLIGMNLGAKQPDVAEKCGMETRRLGMTVATVLGVFFFIFGNRIVAMYNSNPAVIAQGALALKIIGLVQPAQVTQFILAGGLRGAGDTKWPLYSTAIGIWGVRVLLAYIFVIHLKWGLIGAWSAMALDQFTRSLFITMRFRSGRWKTARV